MRRASLNNWIRGFRIKNRINEVMNMTHLLYADYTIIFCEAEQKQLCHIRIILVIFEACSGLQVNWRKSSIFPIKEVQQILALANILKCKIESCLPFILVCHWVLNIKQLAFGMMY